ELRARREDARRGDLRGVGVGHAGHRHPQRLERASRRPPRPSRRGGARLPPHHGPLVGRAHDLVPGACRMKRKILAVVLRLVAWFAVATVCDRLLRVVWSSYAAALPTYAFTLGMLLTRLAIGAASTLTGGRVAAAIARGHRATVVVLGALLLAVFIPGHLPIWPSFPVWYHLTVLAS